MGYVAICHDGGLYQVTLDTVRRCTFSILLFNLVVLRKFLRDLSITDDLYPLLSIKSIKRIKLLEQSICYMIYSNPT